MDRARYHVQLPMIYNEHYEWNACVSVFLPTVSSYNTCIKLKSVDSTPSNRSQFTKAIAEFELAGRDVTAFLRYSWEGFMCSRKNDPQMYRLFPKSIERKYSDCATSRITPTPPAVDRFITEKSLLNIISGYTFAEENIVMAVSMSLEMD